MNPPTHTLRQHGTWLASLAGSALALVMAAYASGSLIPGPRAAYAVAFGAVALSTLVAGATVPRWRGSAALAITAAAVAALFVLPLSPPGPAPAAMLSVCLLAGGTSLGAWLGGRVQRAGHLAAVALVSALADVWSVFDRAAPSAQLAEHIVAAGPGSLSPWVLPWPMLGTAHIEPILGAGDVVFVALYLAAARAHRLSQMRMLTALAAGFSVALAVVIAWERPVPLLPVLGGAVLWAEPAARQLERREQWVLAIAAAGAVLLLLVRSL